MTTAVFFDLDLTLLEYTAAFETIFERAVPNAPAGAYDHYLPVFFEAFADLSTTPYREGFDAVVTEFGLDVDAATLADRYVEEELAATALPASNRRALQRVAARRPTGILTNGQLTMQEEKLRRHGIAETVDAVVVSNDPEVASRKPDSGIFEAAESALPADDYVYVGDTYDEDVVGAREAGWDPIHVGDDGPAADPVRVDTVEDAAARLLD